jgi:hypothetical protein
MQGFSGVSEFFVVALQLVSKETDTGLQSVGLHTARTSCPKTSQTYHSTTCELCNVQTGFRFVWT